MITAFLRIGAKLSLIVLLLSPVGIHAADVTYEYDELGRVTRVLWNDGSEVVYTYDPAGNRLTLNNTPPPPNISFSISDESVTEGDTLSFAVTKTGTTTISHNVSYATANGTAVAGSDYTSTSGTLTFTTADTSKTINVATTQDGTAESHEVFYVNLSSPTGGAAIGDSQGNGTINNDDVTFSINNVSVTEGGTLTFTVTKSGTTTLTHNVTYATANGTATAGSDFNAASGTLSFTPTQTSKIVNVTSVQDTTPEANEVFYVNLSNPTGGATISDSQGNGTINNNDVAFSINNVTVMEGSTLSFIVTKSGATSSSHNVSYATANGTATAGSDYTATSGTLTFTSTQTSRVVNVSTTQDSVVESPELMYVNLSNATGGATISDSQGAGTINSDDVAFSVNNSSAFEGSTVVMTITKTGITSSTHSVSYATANGTATAGSDYNARSGTVTFAPSETSKPIGVSTIQDSQFEANENFRFNLSNPTGGATISDSLGIGTIRNDDPIGL